MHACSQGWALVVRKRDSVSRSLVTPGEAPSGQTTKPSRPGVDPGSGSLFPRALPARPGPTPLSQGPAACQAGGLSFASLQLAPGPPGPAPLLAFLQTLALPGLGQREARPPPLPAAAAVCRGGLCERQVQPDGYRGCSAQCPHRGSDFGSLFLSDFLG